MKKFLVFVTSLVALACSNKKTAEEPAEPKAMTPTNMYGFTPSYSTSFVMDDAKNTETVLALWRDWDNGDLSKSRPHFADSLSLFLADGTQMMGQTDSVLAGVQQYRSSLKNMKASVDAVFAVTSTDRNEDWVAIWGTEIYTNPQGKVDSTTLQETWRFNKDGKVDLMFQANRKGITPPPPAK